MASLTNIQGFKRPRFDLVLITALFLAVFSPFVPGLINDWNVRPDASHGWIVLPLALWIAWTKREAVLRQPEGTSWPALAIVVLGLLAAIVAVRAALPSVGRLAMIGTLNGLLLFHLGTRRYREIMFPALFLFLLIPVPITITGAVTFPLQLFATQAAETVVRFAGIEVLRTGNVLTLPWGSLEVAEACSGLRSAMTFVTLGVLAAWMTQGVFRKIVVALLAIPVAMFANVVRITATALLMKAYGPSVAQGTPHEIVGMVSFLIGLVIYGALAWAMGSRWART